MSTGPQDPELRAPPHGREPFKEPTINLNRLIRKAKNTQGSSPRMDTPTADVFVHSLFARLLMLGDGFNVVPWEQRLKAFGVTGPVGDLQGAYKGYGVCNGSISDYMDLSGTVTK